MKGTLIAAAAASLAAAALAVAPIPVAAAAHPPLVGPCMPGPGYNQAACISCTKANIRNEEICQGQICDPNRPWNEGGPGCP
jgi:hypothetical protein